MTRPLSDLLAGWETRVRQLDENARAEQSEQVARHYAARAAELRDCIEALEREVRAAAQAEAEGRPLLRDALERLLASYCVENTFGDDMCPECREDAEYVHGPGHGEGCPVPIIRAALNVLAAADHGPLECTQTLKDLGGLRVMVPMLLDTVSGERFVAPDVAEVAHNVTQALRARENGYVMVPREALEGVLEAHSETDGTTGNVTCLSCHVTLMDPRTTGIIWQDHAPGCPTVVLRAALAQAGGES